MTALHHTHVINSEQNGRQYRITVSLPWGYSAPDRADWPFNNVPERWSTVYVLDGNWYADMIAGMIRPTRLCGAMTDAIVVGIGYPEDDNPLETFRTVFTRRDHDLTPVHDPETEKSMTEQHKRPVPNGDAEGFLKFIQHELIPFIEKTYQSNPENRILTGHSYGGLFGLYTLFKSPELFKSYVVGSPYLPYANKVMFKQEDDYAKNHSDLSADVYMFTTEGEEFADDTTCTDTIRLSVLLQSRNYAGLTLKRKIFTEYNHCEVAVPGLFWGIKHALKPH